jgi:hypothetical protein
LNNRALKKALLFGQREDRLRQRGRWRNAVSDAQLERLDWPRRQRR